MKRGADSIRLVPCTEVYTLKRNKEEINDDTNDRGGSHGRGGARADRRSVPQCCACLQMFSMITALLKTGRIEYKQEYCILTSTWFLPVFHK